MVFFVMRLKTRAVQVAGIRIAPDVEWMKRIARNLLDPVDGFLRNPSYLIHDRDPVFTEACTVLLKTVGVTCVPIPVTPDRPKIPRRAQHRSQLKSQSRPFRRRSRTGYRRSVRAGPFAGNCARRGGVGRRGLQSGFARDALKSSRTRSRTSRRRAEAFLHR